MHMPHSAPSSSRSRGARSGAAAMAHQAWLKGVALAKGERHDAAITQFQAAIRKAPRDAVYWLNLARSQHKLNQYEDAATSSRQTLKLDPDSHLARQLLAESLRKLHRNAEALQVLQAQQDESTNTTAWHLLHGSVLMEERETAKACQAFLSALAAPDCDAGGRINGMMQLGHCLATLRRYHEAGQCFRTVLDLQPASIGAALYAAHYSAWSCDWPELKRDMDRLSECIQQVRELQEREQPLQAHGLSPFCLLTLTDDPQLLRWAAELACLRPEFNDRPGQPAHRPARLVRPGGKLRVGMVSSDFHHHATAMLMAEMLEHIDRSRIELYFYSSGPDDRSALRRRVMDTATAVHETSQWDNQKLAQQVRDDQIGILIDMKGFTAGSRLGALALRPAPIQVAWLGYPGTSGADFIDYIIGDPVVTPLEAAADFTECIAQLPHCYQPNDSQRSIPAALTRAECGLPEDAVVLASFNQSYKMIPDVFALWCRILKSTPAAVLWLLVPDPYTQRRLRQEALAHGILPQRLIFAPFMDIEQHRARLPNADLFLDTFPCSGHTTASDALWAAVPVLTLCGEGFASRVAASLLQHIGLPELVCTDQDGYFQRATALAANGLRRQELREHLVAARTQSLVFNGRQYAKDFETLLLRMAQRHEAGLAPTALGAQAA
jgi:predicted O-linked N-acetylglucosamine transferase (SPINDLY family)